MQKKIKLDAIFFGTHPDDVELGSGGTIVKLIQTGKKVGIIDLTQGELGTRGSVTLRKKESENASRVLGIEVRENLKIKDGNIELNELNKLKLIEAIRKYKPEVIFAPYPYDRHPDHVNASKLITESTFYSGLEKIKTKNRNSFRPSKVFCYQHAYDIPISFIVDISSTFAKKIEAIKCFESQFYNEKSNEPETFISRKIFTHQIEARARNYGFKIGVEFGEAFFSYEFLKADAETLFKI